MNPVTSPDREAAAIGRRRRITARTRLDFWFDAILLLGFTLAYSYASPGSRSTSGWASGSARPWCCT